MDVVFANPFFFIALFSLAFFLAGLLLGRRWKKAVRTPSAPRAAVGRRPDFSPRAPGRAEGEGPVELYVGNLAEEATSDDVIELFGRYGKVQNLRIITDRASGESKGFGFLEMPDAEEAQAAIRGLHGKAFKGKELVVNAAKSRSGRGGRRRRPRR